MNRRTFLAESAAAIAAGAFVPAAFSAEVAPMPVSGANYAPKGKLNLVVKPNEFVFAAAHLEHGHIYAMCNGLLEAGATLKWVFDVDPVKVQAFTKTFPQAKVARSLEEILEDAEVKLVAAAAITSERGAIGCRVMQAGKDYFTDKAPFTTLEQLEQARVVAGITKRKYMVYFGERIHNEAAMYATDLILGGAIGRVVQVTSLAPHRLSKAIRPAWFFKREQYGGILCDIGSHQFEQFLAYSGSTEASVLNSVVANYANPDVPEFEDYGEATLLGDKGAMNYVRVDWFTPDGLSNWGDGRTFVLGTKGFIEIRKYLDLARDKAGNQLFIADEKGERHLELTDKVGYPFFGAFILDCLNRTEKAMTQAHAFKAAELSLLAQSQARRIST